MPNYLGKLRSFLIIYYRVYAKELIAKVYAKDVKELIIYYYYYYFSRSIGRANLRFSGLLLLLLFQGDRQSESAILWI